MATKRPDKGHDSTMELSVSQLVVPSKRPIPPAKNNPKNDMSLWGGVVVGTQDFTPSPLPVVKPRRSWKWVIVGLGVVASGVAAFLVVSSLRGDDAKPSAARAADTSKADPSSAKVVATADQDGATASGATTSGSGATSPSTSTSTSGAAAASTSGSGGAASGSGATSTSTTAGATAATGITTSAGEVDAISGVAPVIKPPVKKKPVRKVTAKKPAKKPIKKTR